MPDTHYRRAVEFMEAELGDELVALDPARGECFGFNSPAAAVWHELAEPKTASQLKAALMNRYEIDAATCERDLRELLADLQERGLVQSSR